MRETATRARRPHPHRSPSSYVPEPLALQRWSHAAFAKTWRRAKLAAKAQGLRLRTMDLAIAAAVTPATVYNWRNGKGRPDFDEALALASVFRTYLPEVTAFDFARETD